MHLRIPNTPPRILPLGKHTIRPIWSVMIPVYNCLPYLKAALESVLLQSPGPEQMQIEVVDDCSTDGDVAALVNKIGKGRVGYYRQPFNQGSLRNFETCINRAKGYYLHLLHGDDQVKDGFYQEIKNLFDQYPEAGAAFTRHLYMNETGNEFNIGKLISNVPGLLPNWLYTIAQRNRLQPPAIVVKRSVYEQVGSFYAVHFGEDWEMWVRIASKFSFVYSPKCLALYRVHFNNVTSHSILSGQNVKDLKKVLAIIQSYLPKEDRKKLMRQTRKNTSKYIARTARKVFKKYNNPEAALIQANEAVQINLNLVTLGLVSLVYIKYIIYRVKGTLFNLILSPKSKLKNLPFS